MMKIALIYLTRALKPFHSAILYEGEAALLDLVRTVERGESPVGIIRGTQTTDLGTLPAPDFDGLPLEKYFSPVSVLPYDPTRGCYWGKCAFCHYGLAECGTARYRERPVEQAAAHIRDWLIGTDAGCSTFLRIRCRPRRHAVWRRHSNRPSAHPLGKSPPSGG